jgi:hypothetical protein
MPLPLLGGVLGGFLAAAIGGMVARVFSAIGLGLVAYTGVTYMINQATTLLHSQVGGLPSDIAQLLGLAGFDVYLSLVVSARFGVITFLAAHKGFQRISFVNREAG